MPLAIVCSDITKMKVDAIVNAANTSLLGGGGVDGCIHRAAGPGLLAECRALGGCKTGGAKITGGYDLPCRYVIHTVGPIWRDGRHGEPAQLASCYSASLTLAKAHGCASVAFPLISSGAYGCPPAQALRAAVDTIGAFLFSNDMRVYLVVFDRAAYRIGEKLSADLRAYVDELYVPQQEVRPGEPPHPECLSAEMASYELGDLPVRSAPAPELADALSRIDESFSEMLLRKISEKSMTDAACYKRANIDRRLFSKIRGDRLYQPGKSTALAFAIALELPLAETEELLMKAGYALSHSSKSDIIIEYFIRHGRYNVFEINEALFAFNQHLLGQ